MEKDNIFLNDVEVPEVVWEKLDAAFLIINKERENTMKKEQTIEKRTENITKMKSKENIRRRKFAVIVASAAACMIAVVTAVAVNGRRMRPVPNVAEIPSSISDTAEIPSDMVSTSEETFTLAIMGAELEKDKPVQLVSNSSLITEKYAGDWMIEGREGSGVSYCINVPFTCRGNNINNVTYSINNGAFQIVQPAEESIIVAGQLYDGELNTGSIGGYDDESIDGTPVSVPAYETLLYRSFTLDYQKQSDEKTWINICNECPDNGELESMIFGDTTLESKNQGIQNMLDHTIVTCTVNYTDGTSKSADVLVNSRIMTCAEAGAEIKDDPNRKEIFITFELQ